MTFTIEFTPAAFDDITKIKDQRTQQSIYRQIQKLDTEPLKQGKPLAEDLAGVRSLRAAGQRYRVLYRVMVSIEGEDAGTVTVVVVGLRRAGDKKDVYRVASQRLG